MTNLLGKCTKYQPFSGKKNGILRIFTELFPLCFRGAAVLSGLLSVYTSSTSRIGSKNGGWSPIKMAGNIMNHWILGFSMVFPLQFSDPFWIPGNISFPIYVQLAVAKLLLGSEGSRVDKTWQATKPRHAFHRGKYFRIPPGATGVFNLRVFMERRSVAWIPMIRYDSYTQMCQSPAFVGPNCQLSHEQNTLLYLAHWGLGLNP